MANRFWVGGGSANTWAATANTNWAATSGGAFNQSVPGVGDLAIFDSNSGVSNSVIGANITVQGLDCTGGTGNYAGTITHNTGVTLTINTGAATSLRFSSGMTFTAATTSSIITLTHTSGTANITCNGQRIGMLTINGAGGTTQTLDTLLVNAVASSTLTVTSGILDLNGGSGGPFACTAILFIASGATTRSVILGGTVSVGGNAISGATVWNMSGSNLTFTKNSANIIVLPPTTTQSNWQFNGGPQTYNNVTFNTSSSGTAEVVIAGANTFSNLTFNAGWAVYLPAATTQTISNAFTWTGTATNPILITSSLLTGAATISCASGACTLTWGGLLGITASGGATFTATNVLNFGGTTTTGWSITPPAASTFTAAGLATAVWQDTTSGDFTVAGSIGKDLFVGGIAPGGAGGHFIAGTNAATSITTALTSNITGNITGNLSGSVGSVTGAVGSVTGNVGGNVVGSVGSVTGAVGSVTGAVGSVAGNVVGSVGSVAGNVTGSVGSVTGAVGSVAGNVVGSVGSVAGNVTGSVGSVTSRVTANTDQIAGNTTSATNFSLTSLVIGRGTVGSGSTTTSIVTSAYSIAGKSGPRAILFDPATTTTNLRGQGVAIVSSTGGATPTFTVATLTDAPVSGDTFSVV